MRGIGRSHSALASDYSPPAMNELLTILATAVLSSVFTLGLAYLFGRRILLGALERERVRVQQEFEERVRSGVQSAGLALLPQVREQFTFAIRDAIEKSSAELAQDPARLLTRGAELFEIGLSAALGKRPKA